MFTTVIAVGVVLAMSGVALGSFGRAGSLRVTPDDEDDQPAQAVVWSPPRDDQPFWVTDQVVDDWRAYLRRIHRPAGRPNGRGGNFERVLAELRAAHR